MTQLLVGTKKGLFVLEGEAGGPFAVTSRAFAGEPVEFATRDARTGRTFACVTSAFYGPKIFYTDDLSAEWEQAQALELPEDAELPLERTWTIVPAEDDGHLYAGGAPGCALREPRRRVNLGAQPGVLGAADTTRMEPRRGRLCMHSIATWPGDPSSVALAISAVGVWLTDDGGQTWRHGNNGMYPRYMPEEAREETITLCVHNMHRAPTATRAALHAVPRRRVPLRRRRRELDVDRGRPPVRLRLSDGDGSCRPGQRLRHPARGGHGPHHARGARAGLRDAGRRRDVDRTRRRPAVRTTPTSRSSARRSAARDRGRRWSSTSVRRPATSSGQATRESRGSRPRPTSRRCIRCARPRSRGRAPRSRSGRCVPRRESRPRGATRTSPSLCTSARGGRSGRSRLPRRGSWTR